jgi:hypothetical protein
MGSIRKKGRRKRKPPAPPPPPDPRPRPVAYLEDEFNLDPGEYLDLMLRFAYARGYRMTGPDWESKLLDFVSGQLHQLKEYTLKLYHAPD